MAIDIRRNVQNLIKDNQTDEALLLLTDFFKNKDTRRYDELLLLSGKYRRFKNQERVGTLSDDIGLHKINTAILELVNEFEASLPVEKQITSLVKEVSSSDMWFNSLRNHLKVATSLKAYLKEFRAPKEAWKMNLSHIYEINLQFARLIYEHLDNTQIVGYFPSNLPDEESPVRWLATEVSKYNRGNMDDAERKVHTSVKLIHNQPMPNSYTVYIIDHTRLFYNFLSPNGNYEFFDIELSKSIIPYFLNRGFDQFLTEITP